MNLVEQNQKTDNLATGWYYLTNKENGIDETMKEREKLTSLLRHEL